MERDETADVTSMRMIPLLRAGYRCAYALLRCYWFLARPQVMGTLCLLVHDQQLLLIRNTYGRQDWTFPGGMMKRREAAEATIRREVREEVGIPLEAMQSLGVLTGRQAYRRDTIHVFAAQVPNIAVSLDPGEILEARWFPTAALPPLSVYAQRALQLWRTSSSSQLEDPQQQEAGTEQK
jgi:8-oxo-dGTP pyrophosphatase MutT (NUDIX family)